MPDTSMPFTTWPKRNSHSRIGAALMRDSSGQSNSIRTGPMHGSASEACTSGPRNTPKPKRRPILSSPAIRITRLPTKYSPFRLCCSNKKERAREALLKLTELSPRNSSAYVNLGLVNMSMNRGEEAEQDFRKAIEVDPHSIPAFSGLAGYLRLQNRAPDALQILQKGIEANPDQVELQIARADVLYTVQKKEEATATLKQFLDRHPKSVDGALAIGDFYTQRGG